MGHRPERRAGWDNLGSALGDAGQVFIDPGQQGQVLAGRGGGSCKFALSVSGDGTPPAPVNSPTRTCVDPPNVWWGITPPGESALSQVMRLASETFPFLPNLYFAVESPSRAGEVGPDVVVQSVQQTQAPYWVDAESPTAHFGPGQIGALAASGGLASPTLYVLTANDISYDKASPVQAGQVYKSNRSGGLVNSWTRVSNGIVRAYNLFVNPYDPKYLYVTDLGDSTIKSSSDGGLTWHAEPALTNIATNYNEFRFNCGQPADPNGTNFFQNSCPLSSMVFDRNHAEHGS